MSVRQTGFLSKWIHRRSLIAVLVLALGTAIFMPGLATNPPGFYIDESSIAYNAYCLSQNGRDEHGAPWPLYFRAFGEYKNPTYIYLLAALFRLFGPSIMLARALSAAAGLAAVLLLGLLSFGLTRRKGVSVVVAVSAMLTPWLFENSRVVFEVALYPLVLLLFLLVLQRAHGKASWGAFEITCLAMTLALATYTYSVGRLLGPLLAFGLCLFITRRRWKGVALVWLVYLVTLLPLFIFSQRHPGVLTARFNSLTYINPESGLLKTASLFIRHYVGNLSPWKLLVSGGSDLRDHVPGMGMLLAATLILASLGILLIVRFHRHDAWWRFILYGLAVSVVPASLTDNDFPLLRLIPFPVFLLVLTILAWSYLWEAVGKRDKRHDTSSDRSTSERRNDFLWTVRRLALPALIVLTLLQGVIFQWLFHQRGTKRGYIFDSHYPLVLKMAMSSDSAAIYLNDRRGAAGYIQAYWYGTLQGMDTTKFIRLPPETLPPDNAMVISTDERCSNCRMLLKSVNYIVYISRRGEAAATPAPLPSDGYGVKLSLLDSIESFQPGQKQTVNVRVENTSNTTWSAYGEGDGKYAVTLRCVWLGPGGAILANGGSAGTLPEDLKPGQSVVVPFEVAAPRSPGDYILEIDLAQALASWFVRPPELDEYIYERNVAQPLATWFHEHGAQPLRSKVQVR